MTLINDFYAKRFLQFHCSHILCEDFIIRVDLQRTLKNYQGCVQSRDYFMMIAQTVRESKEIKGKEITRLSPLVLASNTIHFVIMILLFVFMYFMNYF